MPSPKYTKTVARRRMPSLLEYANRSCPLPKTCQRPKFLPHIWLVCGNWNTYRILNTYIVMQIDWNFSNFSSSNIRYEEIRFFHKVSFKKPAWSAWNKDSRPPHTIPYMRVFNRWISYDVCTHFWLLLSFQFTLLWASQIFISVASEIWRMSLNFSQHWKFILRFRGHPCICTYICCKKLF